MLRSGEIENESDNSNTLQAFKHLFLGRLSTFPENLNSVNNFSNYFDHKQIRGINAGCNITYMGEVPGSSALCLQNKCSEIKVSS